jgi:carbamoyltransferase
MEPDAPTAAPTRMFLGPRPGPLPEDLRSETRARIAPLDEDALDDVAKVLARGGMVGVASGPLEFGPRALGNRSILMPANDPRLARRLNAALGRPEVMPLAPVVRQDDLPLVTADPPWSALEEMTATVDAVRGLARRFPVAVHADGTMRLQLATRQGTPLLHRILTRYSAHADLALLINTSLNLHTEPIVRTARRAVELYRQLPLDALVLDDQVLLRRAA